MHSIMILAIVLFVVGACLWGYQAYITSPNYQWRDMYKANYGMAGSACIAVAIGLAVYGFMTKPRASVLSADSLPFLRSSL